MRPPQDSPSQPAPVPAAGESLPTLRTSPLAAAQPTFNLSPPDTDAPGTTLPLPMSARRYLLLEEIGRGGMGAVLRARDPHLNRDLALKVLRGEGHDHPELLRRFVEEAQVCSQLQHPGIIPVYYVGRLEDGRPFIAMKLVKGRTLAELLCERAGPADDLPRFLAIFEQVCQAVAYAHSKGVIHRDLKPSNVMAGAFGEVQVMDWGFAKVLRPQSGATVATETAASVIRTVRSACGDHSRDGQALGTPAYMAPEQARGEVEALDARCDVFGLGAILCHVLTGQPPFAGRSGEAHARAMRADLGDAFARLDGCGDDAELIALAKCCLAAEADSRPREAGAVAAVTANQRSVQERLQRAELEKAAAEARAAGERKRRRLAVVLTAAVVALALGGSVWGWQYAKNIRSAEADLNEAAELLEAEKVPAYSEALERAEGRLGGGGPSDLRRRAEELRDLLGVVRRLEQARLTRAGGVREGNFDSAAADEVYRKEFARYGLGGDDADLEEVARRISASPIKGLLVAALDDWASISPEARGRRLLALAGRVDTDAWKNRLRDALARGDKAEAMRLAKEAEPDRLSPSTLLLLGSVLGRNGGADEAVRVLKVGQRLHPGDFWVNHTLGQWLLKQKPSRPGEAEGYYRAALAARPDSPGARLNLSVALSEQGRPKEAEAECRAALRLKPDYPEAHYSLGNFLLRQGRPQEAEAECREAIRLKPDDPEAHCNLGHSLKRQGRFEEALPCLKRGHELGSKQPRWRYPSAQWVRDAERLVALERKLPAILKGQARPADTAEQLGLADICGLTKRHAAAARFYADAFAADPKLAEGLRAGHRYNAALAAAVQGADAPKPDDKERARLRGQALGWLRADLTLWQKQANSGKAEDRAAAQGQLRLWQRGPDLAGVRDKQTLAALPAEERAEWEKLWAEIADLLRRMDAAKGGAAPAGK